MEMLRTLFEFWGWCGRRIIRVGDDDDGEAAVPVHASASTSKI